MQQANFVFGYGSLIDVANLQKYLARNLTILPQSFKLTSRKSFPIADYLFCNLQGFSRCWNIAMDNSIDLPQYKYYVDSKNNIRSQGFVTFLNIRPDKDKTILGILFRVSPSELQQLDRRERNYQRIDVTHQIDLPITGIVWVYIGLKEAEQRYQQGIKQGNAMISQSYYHGVYNAYLSLGKKALTNYLMTTEKPTVPIVNLERRAVDDNY